MISPRRMTAHDWTIRPSRGCRDGVEDVIEGCECGARRKRTIRREQGEVMHNEVVWVEYPDNTGTGFQKEQCPHTGRLP